MTITRYLEMESNYAQSLKKKKKKKEKEKEQGGRRMKKARTMFSSVGSPDNSIPRCLGGQTIIVMRVIFDEREFALLVASLRRQQDTKAKINACVYYPLSIIHE